MLLLFLSIFFQYDLLHCGEEANGEDEFMDYSITEFWWNSTPGINQTDQITPQYSFLPTPIGWLYSVERTLYPSLEPISMDFPAKPLEAFFPFPNTTRPSYPFDIKNYTFVSPTRHVPTTLSQYWHIQYPGLTPPPNFPSDYRYPTIYPYPDKPAYIPSPTGPTPKGPSFTLPEVERPEFTFPAYGLLTSYPPVPSTSPKPEQSPFIWDQVSPYLKKWQQEISSYAAADSRTRTDVVPILSQVFNYDYTTEWVPEVIRRIAKTTYDPGSKLKSSVFEYQTRPDMIETKEASDSVFEDKAPTYVPSAESAIQKSTKNTQTITTATMQSQNTDLLSASMAKIGDDDDIKKNESKLLRILKIQDSPATIPRGEWWPSNETVTTTPTTVTEFLRQNTIAQSYFEMIETLKEGYLIVFLIELTRLIATKNGKAVRDVIKHTDQIIYGYYQSGQLQWFGNPFRDVTIKFARSLKESNIDVIQNHAANLYHMLSKRHEELSVEVNTMLEYADMLYDDDEGRLLFDSLKEFAAYPNISLTGYWLCNSLINSFLRPYRRLKDSQQRQELMDSVNLLVKTRLSSNGFNKEPPLRDGDVKQAVGAPNPPDETTLSTQKTPVTQTGTHSDTTRARRKRKRKRHHRSHKRKRERKRYTITDLT